MSRAETMKEARKRKDWSQERLAAEARVSKATVVNLEKKKDANPTLDVIKRLAMALEVNPAKLI